MELHKIVLSLLLHSIGFLIKETIKYGNNIQYNSTPSLELSLYLEMHINTTDRSS